MAEERSEQREVSWRHLLPWTEIFRTFSIAVDPKKLVVAALGILVMSVGWWVLARAFINTRSAPDPLVYGSDQYKQQYLDKKMTPEQAQQKALADYNAELARYNLLQKAANADDGTLSTMPWFENRGPNPYLLLTSQVSPDEFSYRTEYLVLIEPLVKFLQPVIYILRSDAGFWNRVYFFLVLLWTLATWALFGGVLTRMAAVELAGQDKLTVRDAARFVANNYSSYLVSPLIPLAVLAGLVMLLALFGVLNLIPGLGDFIDGVLWPIPLLIGLGMALVLVGLLGYPLMFPTISAEGSDYFDALSRTYNYFYQAPWHYLWNGFVAVVYGAALLFFVTLMGSLMVYLAKFGVTQTPFSETFNREPEFLFVYAPTTYGWRDLLLQGSPAVDPATGHVDPVQYAKYKESFYWSNRFGAGLVAFWLGVALMLILGFGYSFFWTSATMIYLLMRHKVDDTDLDEVYLEDEETDEGLLPPVPPVPPTPAATGPTLTMVEAPSLRPPPAPPPTVPPPAATSPPIEAPLPLAPDKPPEATPPTGISEPPPPPPASPPGL